MVDLLADLLDLVGRDYKVPFRDVVEAVVTKVTRAEFDDAVNVLLSSGLTTPTEDGVETTEEGDTLAKVLRRVRSTKSRRLRLAESGITTNPPSNYRVSVELWDEATRVESARRRQINELRLEVLEGERRARGEFGRLGEITRTSRDFRVAAAGLVAIGYTETQARHVLSQPLYRQTEAAAAELDAEIAAVHREIEGERPRPATGRKAVSGARLLAGDDDRLPRTSA